jgi:FMN phosphatase YigB (HAD superfamily)
MALTLEQYASYLDTRDLHWPAVPPRDRVKARPHLTRLREIRVVLWNLYGTLLALPGGELWFTHPEAFMMTVALEKTVQEFKMWGSMTRKPGQPSDYFGHLYQQILSEQRMLPSPGEKYPETIADHLWEALIKKLIQKEYHFDAGFYGSLNEFSRKVAYFFHASLQGTAAYDGAAVALHEASGRGMLQGLLADAQSFSTVQLQRGLTTQDADTRLKDVFSPNLFFLSFEQRSRKPSEKLFRHAQSTLEELGVEPARVLHVGSSVTRDLVPARKVGFRTALFAGDRLSLQATADQLKDPNSRPDVLLTELDQLAEVLP